MKRILVLALIVVMVFMAGCGPTQDLNLHGRYIDCEEHWDVHGWQDHTDYCIYVYDTPELIEADIDYAKVTEADIDKIKGYFDDFAKWMEAKDRLDEYSFDDSLISAGDYFLIKTKEGEPIGDGKYGEYDDYTVYFFDYDSLTLYYINQNI